MPRIDAALHARENGWAVASLATLYDATGDAALLSAARASMGWILGNRRAPTRGFGDGAPSDADASLGDTLAVGEAARALYRSTAERAWLSLALELAGIVASEYRHPERGFAVRRPPPDAIGVFARIA